MTSHSRVAFLYNRLKKLDRNLEKLLLFKENACEKPLTKGKKKSLMKDE